MKRIVLISLLVVFCIFSVAASDETCKVQIGDIIAVKYTNSETKKDEVGYKKVLRKEDGLFVYSRVNSLQEESLRYECDLSLGTLGRGFMDADDFLKAMDGIKKVDFVDPIGWVPQDSELYKHVNEKFFTKK